MMPLLHIAVFVAKTGATASFRSPLYLEQVSRTSVKNWARPAAIERYLEHAASGEGRARLIQSLKSYLSSRSLTGTEIITSEGVALLQTANTQRIRPIPSDRTKQHGFSIRIIPHTLDMSCYGTVLVALPSTGPCPF
jgi:hypothetical chaperone protein